MPVIGVLYLFWSKTATVGASHHNIGISESASGKKLVKWENSYLFCKTSRNR